MHAFRRLLLTDLRNRRNTILVTLGATILLNAAMAILTFQMRFPQNTLGFVMFLDIVIFCVLLFVPFLHCFSTWREEWKQHTIYRLLTLPVPRAHLLLSKYISILLETLLISAVMIAGLFVQLKVSQGLLFRAEPLTVDDWSKVLLITKWLLAEACLVFLCSASMLLGKCCGRLSLLVTFLGFVAGLLLWIVAYANVPSIFTLIVVGAAYFAASLYLLEKKVGVE
ncbi:ABC transporter permease [Paenibacillus elgii]|uniref:ABC transporter permease n=1 Tax=Paenibacillus elgii TaxID=189691 RepID=UPI00203FC3D3|nr:ABC transporter permease [Paenibacillus elgii]MCM3271243.1 ABC transporter permease [Paenibacillus elgii]